MKIQLGEIYMDGLSNKTTYPNKTSKYLVPCIKEYGGEFMFKINNVFKVAIGIGDIVMNDCGFKHEKHVFILVDSETANSYFIDFINWVREQPMYEDDYVYGNIQKSTFHMIVLRIPEKYYSSMDEFKLGKYSKMYDEQTIRDYFDGERYDDVRKVFIKDHDYLIHFTKKINRKFGTTLKPEEWIGELDFAPTPKTDIFNHYLKEEEQCQKQETSLQGKEQKC